jgi:rRNA-processing protein FCF1
VAPARLILKDGVKPRYAADLLRARVQEASGLSATVVGIGSAHEQVQRLRDAYVAWAETTESQLATLTDDREVLRMLHTSRYWHIAGMDISTSRPLPLVAAEVRMQSDVLMAMARDCDQHAERARAAPGHITVLDTNVLLHYLPPEQIPWPTLLEHSAVRLVVPLRVIEELDEKKYSARTGLADRVRNLLPRLRAAMGPAGAPGELREAVTIEVPIDYAGRRRRPTDADEEILDTCDELRQFSGQEVTLITADTGMALRAEARRIPVMRIPEEYARHH